MFLNRIRGLLSNDLAIDLGTANTLVYAKGRGVVANEPSVVAVSRSDRGVKRVLSVGREAKEMLGKTPETIYAIRPIKDGVIADFEITEAMLSYFIRRATMKRALIRPRIIVCIPSGITPVEKRAVRESAQSVGSRQVYLIEEPIAAAIGAGLPVNEPAGSMIVDIGGGTTEVAVISMGGIVYSQSIRVAGDKMDEAIVNYMKKKYNLLIGANTAEAVKMQLGSATLDEDIREIEVKGRDLVDGMPKTIITNSEEINDALSETLYAIVEVVRTTLERTPPELSADILDRGVVLAGGGALLSNLSTLLRDKTGLPVLVADDPLYCVVMGSGCALDDIETYKDVVNA